LKEELFNTIIICCENLLHMISKNGQMDRIVNEFLKKNAFLDRLNSHPQDCCFAKP
jgi:hypothetical protein